MLSLLTPFFVYLYSVINRIPNFHFSEPVQDIDKLLTDSPELANRGFVVSHSKEKNIDIQRRELTKRAYDDRRLLGGDFIGKAPFHYVYGPKYEMGRAADDLELLVRNYVRELK
jgi:hypothetical protein